MTLVILPGMDGTGQLFAPFVAALGCEFTVKDVAYPTAAPLGYEKLESIARAALSAEGPYVILGESFSGPIAVSLAASGLPGLKGLVLCYSFVRNLRPLFSGLRSLVAALPLALAPVGFLGLLLLRRFSTSAVEASLAKSLSQVSPSAIRVRLQAVLSVDVSAKWAVVKVAVLYLRASRDSVVPASASTVVAKHCPGARVNVLEAPHFVLRALPAKAAEEVSAFVREIQNAL